MTTERQKVSRSVERKTLMDHVYDLLREDILANRLAPDTLLQEAPIARELDVSRGPVREALRRLEAEGLVEIAPHRGAVVTSLTWQEFIDAYRVREQLETLATRLATPRIGEVELKTLEDLLAQMDAHADAGAVEEFFSVNAEFHQFIVDASANKTLIDIYGPLMARMRRYRMRSLTLRGGLKRSCAEHRGIFEALKAGEADEAARLMSKHIQIPEQILQSGSSGGELVLSPNRE